MNTTKPTAPARDSDRAASKLQSELARAGAWLQKGSAIPVLELVAQWCHDTGRIRDGARILELIGEMTEQYEPLAASK